MKIMMIVVVNMHVIFVAEVVVDDYDYDDDSMSYSHLHSLVRCFYFSVCMIMMIQQNDSIV